MTGSLALVRVRIPDRPGALGLVASRIGALKADIVGIEVLDRGHGSALDELAIVLPDENLIPALTREIAEVDGVVTESVVVVDAFPDPRLDAVLTAVALSRTSDRESLAGILATAITALLQPRWTAVVGPDLFEAVGEHVPADAATIDREATHHEPVGETGVVLHVSRAGDLSPRELHMLAAYCSLADSLWDRVSTT